MAIDRETLRQLGFILRPLVTRMANIAARAVVHLVDDAKKLQLVQLGVEAEEDTGPDAEYHQPYGFSSVPLPGAEAVVVFPNGDREHPLVVSVSDRRHRPRDGEPGEVTMYSHTGAKAVFKANGDVEVTAAPGGKIIFQGATTTGPTSEGVVVGTGIDSFTGSTYNVLGNASSKVFAKK